MSLSAAIANILRGNFLKLQSILVLRTYTNKESKLGVEL